MIDRRAFLARTCLAAGGCTLPAFLDAAPGAGPDPLSKHRIDRIDFRTVKIPWPRRVGRNAVKGIHGHGPSARVCILHTDAGAAGWGHTQGRRDAAEKLRDRVIGKTVSDLIDPAAGIRREELHPIDVPLHDLAGVILGQPVWKMMGADRPFLTRCYSGMIYFDDLDPEEAPVGIDKVLENCRWDVDFGYRQLKVKIGRGNRWMPPSEGLQRDIDVVKAIHDAFPGIDILVDGNNGFTVETMIAFLKGIGDVPLFWIEEPFHETVADWRELRDWLVANGREETLRADGEARPDFPVLEELQEDHTLQVRLEDICGHGFTRWRRQYPGLIKAGIMASPHTWGSALKTAYTAHLVAAYKHAPTVEGVTSVGGDIDFGENRIADGSFHPSSQPGFGLKLPGEK